MQPKNSSLKHFLRNPVEIGDIEKENNINPKKATTTNSIPPKFLENLLTFQPVF